jgi:nickel-dependent lactate racemase
VAISTGGAVSDVLSDACSLPKGMDQWQSQIFARLLLKATVIFVSSCDDQLVEDLHMVPAHNMEEALEKAKALVGKEDYKVTVIPDGVSVIVKES